MAWTYSDWHSQSTDSARLTRLRLYMSELESAITAGVSADGKSIDADVIERRLDKLAKERDRLAATVGSGSGSRVSQARFE